MSRPSKEFMIQALRTYLGDDILTEYICDPEDEQFWEDIPDLDLMKMCDNTLPDGWEEEFWK
jgi:hypothetical protein